MKTPMQEVLETYEVMLSLHSEMAVSVRSVVEDLKSHLEKEKEQIMNAWMDDRFPLDKEWVKQCAEQYYNETFKTKEK